MQRLISVIRRVFVPLALAFLVYAAYTARGVVGQVLVHAQFTTLALTVFAWCLLSLIAPVISSFLLRGIGSNISYGTLLRIYVDRLPARYLPGGIWQTVSRMVDLHALGVSRGQLSVLVLLENLASLAVAMFAGGLCAHLSGTVSVPAPWVILAGIVLAAGLPLLAKLLFKQHTLRLTNYLLALLAILLFWVLAGAIFVFYWSAFPSLQVTADPLNLYASYLLAWVVGFIAIFAPQGIGVTEVVTGLLMQTNLPLAGVAILVAGFRAVMLAGDLLAYTVGSFVRCVAAIPRLLNPK